LEGGKAFAYGERRERSRREAIMEKRQLRKKRKRRGRRATTDHGRPFKAWLEKREMIHES